MTYLHEGLSVVGRNVGMIRVKISLSIDGRVCCVMRTLMIISGGRARLRICLLIVNDFDNHGGRRRRWKHDEK